MKEFFLLPVRFIRQFYRKITKVINYPTVTVEYPYVLKPLVKLARLRIENNFDQCIVCEKCEDACPVHAIEITAERYSEQIRRPKNSKGQSFEGVISKFQIDYSRCVFCGICVKSCPAESLTFDRQFPRPHFEKQALKEDLVHIPRSMRRYEL